MNDITTRRRFLRQSAMLGASATSLLVAGCGGGGEGEDTLTTQRRSRATPAPEPTPTPTPTASSTGNWRPVRIGAGGFVTGIEIANDGTKVVRTDTMGAYIWNDAAGEWRPLLTTMSMPAGEWGEAQPGARAVYEITIAPSDSNRIYVITNGRVFKSVNRGASFTRTALAPFTANVSDDFRTFGRKMAVDPANPDVVLVGTQNAGLAISYDGGATWTTSRSVPASSTAAGVLVAFDPSSGVTNGRTNRIYASSAGRGVYVSNDAGANFSLTPGGPTAHRHMICDQTGALWLTDGALKRFRGGAWSTTGATGTQFHSVAVNPANPRHVVAASDGGALNQSFDGGASWTGVYNGGYPAGSGRRVATDVPWLAWTNEGYMSNGDMRFDPSQSNKLFFAQGIGVWTTNPPQSYVAFDWTSQSRGIEQLVSNLIISPPGSNPLYFAWDRPVFKIDDPNTFPAVHGPNRKHAIAMGWSGDYAVNDPRFVVGLINWFGVEESGYSTDGGATWTKFPSVPAEVAAGKIGGSIAVGTHNNMVWVPEGHANPYYTRDRGATWNRAQIPGVPTSGETGWGFAYYLNRHIVAADKGAADTFYLYNYGPSAAGIYRSTDGGANWTRVFVGELASFSGYNAKLTTVPGKAGHLFFTSGELEGGEPMDSRFMRSVNGGVSWTPVAGVLEVHACGFGKAAAGREYPAIYIAGYVNRTWGIWRSDDSAATWVKVGDYPAGNYDVIKTVSGDMNVYGRVYVGFGGSSMAYGDTA